MTFAKSMRPHSPDEAETWREQDVSPTLNAHDMRVGGEATPSVLVTDEPMAVSQNQRGEVRLTEYSRQIMTSGGKPGEGYPAVLTSSTGASRARTSAWPASGPVYPASAAVSGMSSDASCPSCGHAGWSLKMFPDSFPQELNRAPTSVSYCGGWSTSGMASPGEFWTRDGSESPNAGVVSSLSAVLETRPVPRRYWLSAKAAAGILRRAEKRGKTLPTRLMQALEALATATATRGTPTT